MTDALEQELRSALSERAASMPAGAHERLAQLDYQSGNRSAWRSGRIWSLASAAGAGLAAVSAAAVLLLSSGGTSLVPLAYAGWSAMPNTPTRTELATALAVCRRDSSRPAPRNTPGWLKRAGRQLAHALYGTAIITDQRGRYTAALLANATVTAYCISDGAASGTITSFGPGSPAEPSPRPGQITVSQRSLNYAPGFPGATAHRRKLGPFDLRLLATVPPAGRARFRAILERSLAQPYESNIGGRVGHDVAAVTLILGGRKTVAATVKDGWYFAWWPNRGWPVAVRVTRRTADSGWQTVTSPMPGRQCQLQPHVCVFSRTGS